VLPEFIHKSPIFKAKAQYKNRAKDYQTPIEMISIPSKQQKYIKQHN